MYDILLAPSNMVYKNPLCRRCDMLCDNNIHLHILPVYTEKDSLPEMAVAENRDALH